MYAVAHEAMGLGWPGMILMWVIPILLVALLLRLLVGPPDGPPHRSAREILDERYARGEIDHDEYRARRTTLEA